MESLSDSCKFDKRVELLLRLRLSVSFGSCNVASTPPTMSDLAFGGIKDGSLPNTFSTFGVTRAPIGSCLNESSVSSSSFSKINAFIGTCPFNCRGNTNCDDVGSLDNASCRRRLISIRLRVDSHLSYFLCAFRCSEVISEPKRLLAFMLVKLKSTRAYGG